LQPQSIVTPALAAAAFVNLRLTGDDKGIW